jgi:hypothetical protein
MWLDLEVDGCCESRFFGGGGDRKARRLLPPLLDELALSEERTSSLSSPGEAREVDFGPLQAWDAGPRDSVVILV